MVKLSTSSVGGLWVHPDCVIPVALKLVFYGLHYQMPDFMDLVLEQVGLVSV